ncbi:hypothetical protein LF41_2859 [Lysobacter dokdonensis DS-58]|uniref:Uncharacterized protein n=1 Tax=Lysobacter dokdonensis DS-58 TaxID=1300345 RepID=A0A0A2WHF6_9GAMM|nr:hypothetical protein [Lysobacter dokdonensis]KGQ19213.1 hypothetical protein LF41_2859 [Lysobacter dokdonensis DS-58]
MGRMEPKYAHAVETGRRAARALPDYTWRDAWPLIAEAWILDESEPLADSKTAIGKGWWDERSQRACKQARMLLDTTRVG